MPDSPSVASTAMLVLLRRVAFRCSAPSGRFRQRERCSCPRSEACLPAFSEPTTAARSTCWSRHWKPKGLVRRLAEPNLMALSGDAARFLAGGEFPVPVASTTASGRLSHHYHRIQEVRR